MDELIDAIMSAKSPLESSERIKDELFSRVSDKVEARKTEGAGSMFKSPPGEE